jgi:hypothetical protein
MLAVSFMVAPKVWSAPAEQIEPDLYTSFRRLMPFLLFPAGLSYNQPRQVPVQRSRFARREQREKLATFWQWPAYAQKRRHLFT